MPPNVQSSNESSLNAGGCSGEKENMSEEQRAPIVPISFYGSLGEAIEAPYRHKVQFMYDIIVRRLKPDDKLKSCHKFIL
jgi:hypothetical protein